MTINLTPGQVFAGDFEVQRLLSTGGMGAVYVALQRSTGKPRALKVMLPQLITGGSLEEANKYRARFMAEAQAGARIASEHVVEVVVAGIDAASGAPWLAMELLEGESLEQRLARGPLTLTESLELFDQLGHALSAAHRVGLFHLDLKPENIFLARARSSRGGTTVKVLDFGIARLVSEKSQGATMTTAMGSPLWMSPEQSRAGSQVGPYTDVWSLGLVVFKCLTGRNYWRGANHPNGDVNVAEWLVEMASQERVPPSVRARELGVPGALPQGFDGWFCRAVHSEATLRFPDASSALHTLTAILQGASSQQTAPGYVGGPTMAASATPSSGFSGGFSTPTPSPFAPASPRVSSTAQASPAAPSAFGPPVGPFAPYAPPAAPFGAAAMPHAPTGAAPPPFGAPAIPPLNPAGSGTMVMDFNPALGAPFGPAAMGAPPPYGAANSALLPPPSAVRRSSGPSGAVLFVLLGGGILTLIAGVGAVAAFVLFHDGDSSSSADASVTTTYTPPTNSQNGGSGSIPNAQVPTVDPNTPSTFALQLDQLEGLDGRVTNGSSCLVTVGAADSNQHCRLTITCGATVLYGMNQNFVPNCTAARQSLLFDQETTRVDNDPSVRIDRSTHRVEMTDDSTGTHGAYSLGGTFTER